MNILFISSLFPPYAPGGAEKIAHTLALAVRDKGHTVSVITLAPDGVESTTNQDGISVFRVPLANLYWPYLNPGISKYKKVLWHLRDITNKKMDRKVAEILDMVQPDWALTHTITGFSGSVWKLLKEKRIPCTHMLHDYYAMCVRSMMFKKGDSICKDICGHCRPFAAIRNMQSAQVDSVIGVSDFILQEHLKRGYFPNARTFVIHNSKPIGSEPMKVREKKKGTICLGYIGRIEPSKGLEVLLRELKSLSNERWILKVAGSVNDPAYFAKLKSTYPYPNVEYLGFVDSFAFYQEIDLLVVPSIWNEPFGLIVIESFGFGIPVIASNRGGMSEIVQNGVNGFLFEPDKVGDLAGRLSEVIADDLLYRRLSEGAVTSRSKYLPHLQADAFLEVVKSWLDLPRQRLVEVGE